MTGETILFSMYAQTTIAKDTKELPKLTTLMSRKPSTRLKDRCSLMTEKYATPDSANAVVAQQKNSNIAGKMCKNHI